MDAKYREALEQQVIDLQKEVKSMKKNIIINIRLMENFKVVKVSLVEKFLENPEGFNVHDTPEDVRKMSDSTALYHMLNLAEMSLLEA